MSEVLVLAVVSALDAGLLTAAVVLLGRPRPARQLGAYLIGGMGFSIVFGLAIVLALHGSNLLTGRAQSIIGVEADAMFLVVAIAVGSGRAAMAPPPERETRGRPSAEAKSPGPRARQRLVVDRVGH